MKNYTWDNENLGVFMTLFAVLSGFGFDIGWKFTASALALLSVICLATMILRHFDYPERSGD